jgi:hypothetical protein
MPHIGLVLMVAALAAVGCQQTPSPTQVPTPAATLGPASSPNPTVSHEPAAVQAIDSSTFSKFGGCGDVFTWATNAQGTMAITMEWQGAATAAWQDGGFEETASLAEAPVAVSLVAGRGLDGMYCNDVLTPEMGEDNNVRASTGTVRLNVRPDADGFEPASHADVALSDIVFNVIVGTEEETWQLDELIIENVSVGWLAG